MGPAERVPSNLRLCVLRTTKLLRKERRHRKPDGLMMEQKALHSTERYRFLPSYAADLVLELSLPHGQARGR